MRLAFALLFSVSGLVAAPAPSSADRAVLDLSQLVFPAAPPQVLGPEWEFYPGSYFYPRAKNPPPAPQQYIRLPATWQGDGFAAYRLRVRLPQRAALYAIHMEAQLSAYDLWVNGERLAASGQPGVDAVTTTPATKPIAATFTASGECEIVLQVANFHHRKGGVFKKIYFGAAERMQSAQRGTQLTDMCLGGILIIMALYHIVIFLLRRSNRAALLFGIACLLILGRLMTTGEKLVTVIFPETPLFLYTMVEYLSYFWAIPVTFDFFHELYPGASVRIAYRVAYVLAALFSLCVFVTPLKIYSHTSYLYIPVMVAAMLILFAQLIRLTLQKRPNAAFMLFGFALLAFAVVNDTLNTVEILRTGYVLQFGFMGIVLCYAGVLAARFSRAFYDAEVANENLEQRVRDRTHEIHLAKEEAERANRMKDNFIALVSHDLRSPLSGLNSLLELLMQQAGMDPQQREKLLRAAQKSVADMLHTIESLLQLSRFRSGIFKTRPEPTRPAEIVALLVGRLGEEYASKGILWENQLSPEFEIRTDPYLLQHVFLNLMTNAAKFSHKGGTVVIAHNLADPAVIDIIDHGVGMTPEQLEALFSEGQKVSKPGTAGERGSGLGLMICREILNAQGGGLTMASTPGEGSRCSVRIKSA